MYIIFGDGIDYFIGKINTQSLTRTLRWLFSKICNEVSSPMAFSSSFWTLTIIVVWSEAFLPTNDVQIPTRTTHHFPTLRSGLSPLKNYSQHILNSEYWNLKGRSLRLEKGFVSLLVKMNTASGHDKLERLGKHSTY